MPSSGQFQAVPPAQRTGTVSELRRGSRLWWIVGLAACVVAGAASYSPLKVAWALRGQKVDVEPLAGISWSESEGVLIKVAHGGDLALTALKRHGAEPDEGGSLESPLEDLLRRRGADGPSYLVNLRSGAVKDLSWDDWLSFPGAIGRERQGTSLPDGFGYSRNDATGEYLFTFSARPLVEPPRKVFEVFSSPDRKLLAALSALGPREGRVGIFAGGTAWFRGPFICEFFRASDGKRVGPTAVLRGCDRLQFLSSTWSPDGRSLVIRADRRYADVVPDMVWVVQVEGGPAEKR